MALLGNRQFARGSVGNLGTGETTVYTQPALRYGRVDSVVAYNPSGGALILTLHIVPVGGAAGSTNEVCQESIASHARLNVTAGQVLAPGDIISGKGDSAGLNVWVGVEIVDPPGSS